MSYVKVIPCLDFAGGRVVKGVNFVNLIDAGDPAIIAKAYVEAGADELVFLDINATVEERETVKDMVRRVAKEVSIPFTVGGGIRTIDDVKDILDAGADKVSINSAAFKNPNLIKEIADTYGSDKVVVAIDVAENNGKYDVLLAGGTENTGACAIAWAKEAEKLGAGSILLTSMDRDGMKTGYDNKITRLVSEAVSVPVVASGGAGELSHFKDAVVEGKASAVLAASLFHFKEVEIKDVKNYLKENNIPVRL